MEKLINSKGGLIATFSSDERTILESLEKSSVEISAQCRDGHCGACRCKLTQGEVKYINTPLAFLEDGEFLPCSTVAVTDIDIILPT